MNLNRLPRSARLTVSHYRRDESKYPNQRAAFGSGIFRRACHQCEVYSNTVKCMSFLSIKIYSKFVQIDFLNPYLVRRF